MAERRYDPDAHDFEGLELQDLRDVLLLLGESDGDPSDRDFVRRLAFEILRREQAAYAAGKAGL